MVIGVQESGKIRSRTELPAGLVTGFDISKKTAIGEDVGQPESSEVLQSGIYNLHKIRRIHTETKMRKRNFKADETIFENALKSYDKEGSQKSLTD